ncbi:DUF6241 domain-containing protein [Paenibacillus favisporus]|uniref:DUF6241 domain-containing protein n=1 Tax=Paenibacillus TaxID=44249 RepID=UPI0011AB2E2C|nr:MULTISPECIES: DUF6241 domain-containing protein [Paenibacillus]MEC0176961.1 DUF6241 domain-containing protein [Paenibacillus favisporus]
MSTKKRWVITVVVVAAIAVAVGTGLFVKHFIDALVTDPEDRKQAENLTPAPTPKPGQTRTNLGNLRTDDNDQVDLVLKDALKPEIVVAESDVVNIMHHMTHQKVKAKEKWVSIEMTPERVQLLEQIIQVKGTSWINYARMLDIAKKWETGDFSTVDEDHNFFWMIENGSIGKAKGVLTEKEEQEFIKNTFHKE